MSNEMPKLRIVSRIILAWAIASFTSSALILLFTLDWETTVGGSLVSLFAFPSILLFFIGRSSRRWSRYASVGYAVPAVITLLLFFVPALIANEGRDLAQLLGFVLLGTLIIMFRVSSVLAVSAPETEESTSQ